MLEAAALDGVLLQQHNDVLWKKRADLVEPLGDTRECAALDRSVRTDHRGAFPFTPLDLIAGVDRFEGLVELALVAPEDRVSDASADLLKRFFGGLAKDEPPAGELG